MKHEPLSFGRRMIVDHRRRAARQAALASAIAAVFLFAAATAAGVFDNPGAAAVLGLAWLCATVFSLFAISEA